MRELAAALPRALAAFPARIASRPIRLLPSRRAGLGLTLTPKLRLRLLIALAVTIALGLLYQLWLRDSSLVAVNSVEITGLTTKDAPRIRAALGSVAEDMTTLHVRVEELEEAARAFPVIKSLTVETDFPHGLRIEIVERRPAALVSVDGVPTPVAGDGTVLSGIRAPAGLPLLRMEKPAGDGAVTDPRTLRALLVMGAAPAGFPQRIERVSEGPARGIVVALADGPEIVFGDADRAAHKWMAAARVLADPDAAGATYVDVRLPERPVAGGLPVETIEPVAPAGDPVAVPPPAATAADPATATDAAATGTDPAAGTDPATTAPAPTAAPVPDPAAPPPAAAAPAPAGPAPTGAAGGAEAPTSPQP